MYTHFKHLLYFTRSDRGIFRSNRDVCIANEASLIIQVAITLYSMKGL